MNAISPRCISRITHRLLAGCVLTCLQLTAGAADLSGYWTLDFRRSELAIDAASLTATSRERVQNFTPAKSDPTLVCMPYGMPRVMTALGAFPMEIVQTDAQVTMIFDGHDEVRRVMLDAPKRSEEEIAPLWLGYASGRWDGDTLVATTIGMTDQSLVTARGIPHSSELVVTERFRRLDDSTLLNEMTLEDPKAFVKPVTRKLYYQRVPELQPREFHCNEQLWLDHVMDRAKELTRELVEKKQ
jgi:hypothetical protein